jgi:hypothetical protein
MTNGNKRALLWAWMTVGVATAALVAGCWAWQLGLPHGGKPARPDMRDWDVPRLVDHLHDNGVDLHMTSPYKGKPVADVAYLSESERPWEELIYLPASPEAVDKWRGVVYCEKVASPAWRDQRIAQWGDACLDAPPFLFFGDRQLLGRIGGALQADDRTT